MQSLFKSDLKGQNYAIQIVDDLCKKIAEIQNQNNRSPTQTQLIKLAKFILIYATKN